MRTLQEQYNLIKEGKGHKDVFLKEAKQLLPNMITNSATFEEATHILKNRSVIAEHYIDIQPLNTITSEDLNGPKQPWELKFANYLEEVKSSPLEPIVNNDSKTNTAKEDESIKADTKKVDKSVENVASHNYDYSPKVDNINNVNAQELLNGVYCELKNNPKMELEEAQEKVIKNLAKDPLHYIKNGMFGVEGLGYQEQKVEEVSGKYAASGYSDKVKEGSSAMVPVKESLLKQMIKEHLGGVVTGGNPNSFASQSGNMIRQMMAEEGLAENNTLNSFMTSLSEENEEKDLPMDEAKGKDVDKDGDVDSDDYMAAKDKAIKASKNKDKKIKKPDLASKLKEVENQGAIVTLEAKIELVQNEINTANERLNQIDENSDLAELMDKIKLKEMRKSVSLMEKEKATLEKIYEKMCGKSYQRAEMVDESGDSETYDEKIQRDSERRHKFQPQKVETSRPKPTND